MTHQRHNWANWWEKKRWSCSQSLVWGQKDGDYKRHDDNLSRCYFEEQNQNYFIHPERKIIFCCSSNSKSKSRNRGEGEGFPSPSLIVLPRPSVFSRDVFYHSQKVCFLQPQQGETPQPNNSLRPSNRAGTSAQRTLESLFGHGVGGGDTHVPATCLSRCLGC